MDFRNNLLVHSEGDEKVRYNKGFIPCFCCCNFVLVKELMITNQDDATVPLYHQFKAPTSQCPNNMQ